MIRYIFWCSSIVQFRVSTNFLNMIPLDSLLEITSEQAAACLFPGVHTFIVNSGLRERGIGMGARINRRAWQVKTGKLATFGSFRHRPTNFYY